MVSKKLPYDTNGLPYDVYMGDSRPQCHQNSRFELFISQNLDCFSYIYLLSFFGDRFTNSSISLEETCYYQHPNHSPVYALYIRKQIFFSLMSLALLTRSGISVDPVGLSMLQSLSNFLLHICESRLVSHPLL